MAAKSRKFCILLLRLLAFGATLSAAVVMVTSHQKIDFFTIHLEAKYSDTPAFKYFVYANAIGSVYGFIVLFVPPASMLGQLVQALDVVITMLLTSGISTALAIAYVGKKGNSSAGWRPICGQVPRYCDHVTGALTAGFIGLIIYVAFVVSSFHAVFKPLLAQKA